MAPIRAGTAYVNIEGDFSHLNKEVATHLGRISKQGNNLGKSLSRGLGRGIGAGAGVAAVGVGALGAEIVKATKGWSEHQAVTRRTAAVIKSTGSAARVSAKHVESLSDAIERKTGVDGDAIQSGANLLLTFTNVANGVGKSNKIFDQATSTVVNMSKALGQDTKSSAIQLGKALNDPVKGITALSRVGVSFTQQQKDQIKTLVASGKTMDAQKIILQELGKEFPKVDATPFEKLVVVGRKVEDTIGKAVLPIFNKFVDDITPKLEHFANAVGDVFEDKNLNWEEKIKKIGASARHWFGPMAESLAQGLKDAKLDDKLQAVIEWAIPKIAAGFGAAAPRALDAFWNAFKNMNTEGKALAVAVLATKLGLTSSLMGAIGGRMAGQVSTSFAKATPTQMSTATQGAGFKAQMKGVGAGIGTSIGIAAASFVTARVLSDLATKDWKKALEDFLDPTGAFGDPKNKNVRPFKPPPGAAPYRRDSGPLRKQSQELPSTLIVPPADTRAFEASTGRLFATLQKRYGKDFPTLLNYSAKTGAINFNAQIDFLENKLKNKNLTGSLRRKVKEDLQDVERSARVYGRRTAEGLDDALKDMGVKGTPHMKKLRESIVRESQGMARGVKGSGDKMKTQLDEALKDMGIKGTPTARATRRQIERAFSHLPTGVGATSDSAAGKLYSALNSMKLNANQILTALGIKPPQIKLTAPQRAGKGAVSGTTAAQRGQYIHGSGDGDTVPAMLEPGEYVLNKKAVKKVGKRKLDQINWSDAPRFQTGGGVNWGGHPPLSGAIAHAVGLIEKHFPGIGVSATTDGNHVRNSYHFRRMATDLAGSTEEMLRAASWIKQNMASSLLEGIHNPNLAVKDGKIYSGQGPFGDVWAGHANHIHIALASLGKIVDAAVATEHVGRPKITGAGFLGEAAQGVSDLTRRAINKFIDKKSSTVADTPGDGAVSFGPGALSKGEIKSLWVRAGGDPGVANIMAAIAMAESGGIPSRNNADRPGDGGHHIAAGLWQILGLPFPGNVYDPLTNARMAVSKYNAGGFRPWVAYTNGSYRKYLQKGGLVDMMAKLKVGGGIGIGLPNKQLETTEKWLRRHSKTAKGRARGSKKMAALQKKLKDVGLTSATSSKLVNYEQLEGVYADYADRASKLDAPREQDGSKVDAKGMPLDKFGRPVYDADGLLITDYGTVNGKNQGDWLNKQLSQQTGWRDLLIKSIARVLEIRLQVSKAMKAVQDRIEVINDNIKNKASWTKTIESTRKSIKTEMAKPAGRRDQRKLTGWRKKVADLQTRLGRLKTETTERASLQKLNNTLTGKQEALDELKDNGLVEKLTDIQGVFPHNFVGGPNTDTALTRMKSRLPTRYAVLPTDIGAIGGRIADTRIDIRDIGVREKRPEGDTTNTGADAIKDLTLGLQQAEIQRLRAGQIFENLFRSYPFGGAFAEGGTVPGPVGSPRMILAHGGETVLTADESSYGSSSPDVSVSFHGNAAAFEQFIDKRVEYTTRRDARAAGRGLPGGRR